jgi:pyruvate,water dikinase
MKTAAPPLVIPLAELASVDRGLLGGKAHGLATLAQAGLPVPDGIVVTRAAYREAARDGLAPDAVPAALAEAIADAVRALGDGPLAVRSSAADEDGGEHSAAGQYLTRLGVRGPEAVLRAVVECWASLADDRADAYRRASGHCGQPAEMAVVVQRMIEAEVAGVVFTADPLTGDPSVIVINASWGLGESVVSGTVTPDDYRVARDDGRIVAFEAGWKDVMMVVAEDGVRSVGVPAERWESPTLDGRALSALREGALRCEAILGRAADLEFCLRDRAVTWLQCRPVTALVR